MRYTENGKHFEGTPYGLVGGVVREKAVDKDGEVTKGKFVNWN